MVQNLFFKNKYENFVALTTLTTFFLMHMVDYQIFGGQWYSFFHKDIENWDIGYENYYEVKSEVERIIPVSSSNDNLQDFFGINFGKEHKFNLSNQEVFFKKSV